MKLADHLDIIYNLGQMGNSVTLELLALDCQKSPYLTLSVLSPCLALLFLSDVYKTC